MSQRTTPHPFTSVCLDCRTALREGERCDGGAAWHRVVSLRTLAGRKRLVEAVWGPLKRQQVPPPVAANNPASTGATLEGAGRVNWDLADAAGSAGDFVLLLGILDEARAAALQFISKLKLGKLGRLILRHRERPRPSGASRQPNPATGRHVVGTIVAADEPLLSPSGQQAAAYGLELHHKSAVHSSLILRAGFSASFTVRLDDGALLHIPRGRLRVAVSAEHALRADSVHAFLSQLDRRHVLGITGRDPFPWESALEDVLQVGDRVEVIAGLESVPAAGDAAATPGYRESSATFQPRHVAFVRLASV